MFSLTKHFVPDPYPSLAIVATTFEFIKSGDNTKNFKKLHSYRGSNSGEGDRPMMGGGVTKIDK